MDFSWARVGTPLIGGDVLRIAVGEEHVPLTHFWRIWTNKNDVYAKVQADGSAYKISVHESGQIHVRRDVRESPQLFTPLMAVGNGWMHAFEVRFFLSDSAFKPPKVKFSDTRWILIDLMRGDLPEDQIAILDVLIGEVADAPLPERFGGARVLWRTTLKNGRHVVVISRVTDMNEDNRSHLQRYRNSDHTPRATLETVDNEAPKGFYMELWDLHWSPSGNVFCVIPMGPESLIVSKSPIVDVTSILRTESPGARLSLVAPNEDVVAELQIDRVDTKISVTREKSSVHKLASVELVADFSKLKAGERYEMASVSLPYGIEIEGIAAKDVRLIVKQIYKDDELTVRLSGVNASIQPKMAEEGTSALELGMECIVSLPSVTCELRCTRESPSIKGNLESRIHLRAKPALRGPLSKATPS